MKRLALPLLLAAALVVGSTVAAQDPPPPAVSIPQPAECVVTPRTVDGLRALAPGGTRSTTPAAALIAPSPLLDPGTRAEIEAAIRRFIACRNTGDSLRILALYTDDYLRSLPTPGGYLVDSPAMLTLLGTPTTVSTGYFWPLPIGSQLTELPDGRIAARLTFQEGGQAIFETTILFASQSGFWLVDDMLARTTPATPTGEPAFDPEDLLS